jgi:hypothetical protein
VTVYLRPYATPRIMGDCAVVTQVGNGFRRHQGSFYWHDLFNLLIATDDIKAIVIVAE